jgi:hypothetical protein
MDQTFVVHIEVPACAHMILQDRRVGVACPGMMNLVS